MTQDTNILRLYLAHRPALIDYATPIIGSRTRAEDVVQEAWLRLAARCAADGQRDPMPEPVGYLYRVVRNLAIDIVRRSRFEFSSEAGNIVLATTPSSAPSPEEQALYRDRLRAVDAALAELPPRTRLAFEMHRLAGRTLQETATALGISVTRTHQLICTALTHCADRLDELDGGVAGKDA